MKILEMIATLGPGGAEALTADLSVKFAKRGAEVKVFLLAGVRGERGKVLQKRLAESNIEIIGIDERKPASFSNLIMLRKTINEWRPDVVHCHLYNSEVPFAITRYLSLYRPVMTVRTLHNTEMSGYSSKFTRRFLDSAFHLTVACSMSVEDSYKRINSFKRLDTLVTIENGCTLAEETTSYIERQEARVQFSINDDKYLIINIGGFRGNELVKSQKAQDILLKAFSAAFAGRDDVLLAFAGDGPLRIDAEKLAIELGIESKVLFLGNLPEPWKLLHAADLFAMPSRHEGLSLALLEAASTGLPVVASDIPEIRRISPGDAWQLCPVEDVDAFSSALQTAIAAKESFRAKAETATEIIRLKYSIDNCSERYWELFARNADGISVL